MLATCCRRREHTRIAHDKDSLRLSPIHVSARSRPRSPSYVDTTALDAELDIAAYLRTHAPAEVSFETSQDRFRLLPTALPALHHALEESCRLADTAVAALASTRQSTHPEADAVTQVTQRSAHKVSSITPQKPATTTHMKPVVTRPHRRMFMNRRSTDTKSDAPARRSTHTRFQAFISADLTHLTSIVPSW